MRPRGAGGFSNVGTFNTDAGGYWVVRQPAIASASYRFQYRTALATVNSAEFRVPRR